MNRASTLLPLLAAAALGAGLGCTEEDLCHGPSCRVCPPEGCPSSAGVIHRSVGPGNTAPLASGEANPLLRIEGSVATFREPLPDRVGVGDALAATFGDTTLLAFVTLRRSAVAYELQTADGGAPRRTAPGRPRPGASTAPTPRWRTPPPTPPTPASRPRWPTSTPPSGPAATTSSPWAGSGPSPATPTRRTRATATPTSSAGAPAPTSTCASTRPRPPPRWG
jgi:hypothetical protein